MSEPLFQYLSSEGALTALSPVIEASSMTYAERLFPWCIIRLLPNLQRLIVARFRRRGDAEAHLKTLQRMVPHVTYEIVFDVALIRWDDN